MKRLFPVLLSLSFLLGQVSIVDAHTSEPIQVIVDGAPLDFDLSPVQVDGTTLVPLRTLFEKLGAGVEWVEATRTVTVEKLSVTMVVPIDSTVVYKNGVEVKLPHAVQIINDRAMIPVRLVAEVLGAEVRWDEKSTTVSITSSEALLFQILQKGDPSMMQDLQRVLEGGIDPNVQNENGRRALHLALRGQNLEMVQLLLDHGADPHLTSMTGDTPLNFALKYVRDPEVLKMLERAGLNVLDHEKHGTGLLTTAIAYQNTPMLKALLAAGVNPNQYPMQPPLVQAALKGDAEMVQALLEAKADWSLPTAEGHTAMMYALAANRQEVVQLLRQAGDTTTTWPSDFSVIDETAEVERLQGRVMHELITGSLANEYGLRAGQAILFVEIPNEDDREGFFNLSEQAQKQLMLDAYKEHTLDVSDVVTCDTYITFDHETVVGARIGEGSTVENVNLVFGAKIPLY